MLYALVCYNSEAVINAWTQEKDDAVMADHAVSLQKLAVKRKLGPVARLMPTTAATTVRSSGRDQLVLDGPFAETKEQLLGFYVIDCESLEEAIETARSFVVEPGAIEVRPVSFFEPGVGLGVAPK